MMEATAPCRAEPFLSDGRTVDALVSVMARHFGDGFDPERAATEFTRAMEIDPRFRSEIRAMAPRLQAASPAPPSPTFAIVSTSDRPVLSADLEQKVKLRDWLAIAAPAFGAMLILGLGPLSVWLR